ncbi:neprilysin-4 [Drosophila tropicalis]|uniref:neprilysin-4 n=1 Tax=Drosophila tropicalis TaxID=46794 RepID=UPI0035AB745D
MLSEQILIYLFILIQLIVAQTDTESDAFTLLYKKNLQDVIKIRNVSIDPCDNFYRHACGNYETKITNSNNNDDVDEDDGDTIPPFLYNKQDRMDFFQRQSINFQTLPGQMLSQLYKECSQTEKDYTFLDQVPGLREHKEVLEAWPFLRHQWERRHLNGKLNWLSLSSQLASQGVPTLLNIYFAEQTIYITPIDNLPCPTTQEFQLSLVEDLENRHHHVSQVIGNEMRILCRGMRGELPMIRSQLRTLEERVSDNKDLHLDENMMAYFENFFSHLQFTHRELQRAKKLPLDVTKIAQAWLVLKETEPRIIYNYIIWQVKQKFKEIQENCHDLTTEFERLLFAEYWQWHIFEPYIKRDVALASYHLHTTKFYQKRRSQLSRRDWLGYLWPKTMEKQELQLAKILQTYAQSYLNISQINHHFQEVKFEKNSFFYNLLQLRQSTLRFSFHSPYLDEEDPQMPAYFLRHFMHFVILSLYRPTYHYYATQGLSLWLQSRLLEDTDGYYSALNCLEQQSLQHSDDMYRQLSTKEVQNIFNFYRGFVYSLKDYQFWLQGERFAFAENFILQYFNLNTEKIMFYAVVQQFCGRQDDRFSTQLNRVYMNIPEFQYAFNCDSKQAMSPSTKCMINQCEINEIKKK